MTVLGGLLWQAGVDSATIPETRDQRPLSLLYPSPDTGSSGAPANLLSYI